MRYISILALNFLCLLFLAQKVYAQIDCNSSSGITALMAAPVILNPTDVDQANGVLTAGGPLLVQGNTKIFLNPPSTIPSGCANAIKMFVFFSTSQSELSGLPSLATQNLATLFATKKNVQASMTSTTDPNVKFCSATLPKVDLIENQVVFYRWAKLINHPTDTDPMVWSSILSYSVKTFELIHLKFDVDLELDHLVVKNVRDLDGTEDFIGDISFYELKAISRNNSTIKPLWPPPHVGPYSLKAGTYKIDRRIPLISNLTFDELRNIELRVGGFIRDDEGAAPANLFYCNDCPFPLDTRNLKFIGFPSTQTSIYNLLNNGVYQQLQFGNDNYFELNYYEYGDEFNGWEKFMWKVWIKPHQ